MLAGVVEKFFYLEKVSDFCGAEYPLFGRVFFKAKSINLLFRKSRIKERSTVLCWK